MIWLQRTDIRDLLEGLRTSQKGDSISPHKGIMLLALIQFLEEGGTPENRFLFEELEPLFVSLMRKFRPQGPLSTYALEYPFFHLQSDGFWYLKPKHEKLEQYENYKSERKRFTKRRLLETVNYGYLSKKVFDSLSIKADRKIWAEEIIDWLYKNRASGGEKIGPDIVREKTSLFEHEGIAIQKIKSHLGDSFSFLSNILIWDRQTNEYYEYDLIIVCQSGIYVIELKHWSGEIEIQEYQWRIDRTRYRNDPHRTNKLKCQILKGIYERQFSTYPRVWVESVVILTNPDTRAINADSPDSAGTGRHNLTFASITDLVSYLRRKEAGKCILQSNQIKAITEYLYALNQPKHDVRYVVPGYETVEYLSQKLECVELLARPIGLKGSGLSRLRVFRFVQDTTEERERFRKIAMNTLNAVHQIGDKPHIHNVAVLPLESGDIVEISDWSDTGTLRDLIANSKERWPVDETMAICSGIACALMDAHALGIIHRAIKPENILMKNNLPKLMNFDLAFQPEDERLTVIPEGTRIKDDGYVAPELLFGDDVDESTDYFSLGVIAYQLLTGEKPFRSTRQFVAHNGYLDEAQLRKLKQAEVPIDVVEGIKSIIVAEKHIRRNGVDKFRDCLATSFSTNKAKSNSVLKQGVFHNMKEIIELIGSGRESQVYKAKTSRGSIVALKLFNWETPLERVHREIEIGCLTNSPYVVNYDANPEKWKDGRYFALMDYVPGRNLRDRIEAGERPSRQVFDYVVKGLLLGIQDLHMGTTENDGIRPIVHGDIKPENIIITDGNKPVLIDLGLAGPPRVGLYQGTNPYIPPYSIRDADRHFSMKCDLFALGVTLWEWLFGTAPYGNSYVGQKPILPEQLSGFEDLNSWLIKAISTKPESGFSSVSEMWAEFVGAIDADMCDQDEEIGIEPVDKVENGEKLAPVHLEIEKATDQNSFVTYLNTLTATSPGNENAIAENQFTNEFFPKIYVSNPISDEIYRLINQGRNVILTGNAGDGKTTIAVDILKRFKGGKLDTINRREEVLKHSLVVIKDMSEFPPEEHPLIFGEALEQKEKTYLIVSNTGTLLAAFETLGSLLDRQFDGVINALEATEPTSVADENFTLLNIGQMDSVETACRVFARMLEPDNWHACKKCTIRDSCVIYQGATLLQSNEKRVLHRIHCFYKRLYEYGYRLTMRQMTGHLGYALTGSLHCVDLLRMSLLAREALLERGGFVNWFFGDDGKTAIPHAENLKPVRVIKKGDFGSVLLPEFERMVWLKKEVVGLFNIEAKRFFERQDGSDFVAHRRKVRRLAFFCGNFAAGLEKRYVNTFLDSPMLVDYLTLTGGGNIDSLKLNRLRDQVLHILQEQFMGLRLPEAFQKAGYDLYITLKPPQNIAITQMVLARLRKQDFQLTIEPRYQYSSDAKARNMALYLVYNPSGRGSHRSISLELDLPFFDYVVRRYGGDLTYQLSSYYQNRLENFKGQLLAAARKTEHSQGVDDVLHLVQTKADRRFAELKLRIIGNKLEVI